MTVLGIPDPAIWSAYLLCILSALACVVYGMMNWDKGDEQISSEDVTWVKDEKKAKENI